MRSWLLQQRRGTAKGHGGDRVTRGACGWLAVGGAWWHKRCARRVRARARIGGGDRESVRCFGAGAERAVRHRARRRTGLREDATRGLQGSRAGGSWGSAARARHSAAAVHRRRDGMNVRVREAGMNDLDGALLQVGMLGTGRHIHCLFCIAVWCTRRHERMRSTAQYSCRPGPDLSGQNLFFSVECCSEPDARAQTTLRSHRPSSVRGVPLMHGWMELIKPHPTM